MKHLANEEERIQFASNLITWLLVHYEKFLDTQPDSVGKEFDYEMIKAYCSATLNGFGNGSDNQIENLIWKWTSVSKDLEFAKENVHKNKVLAIMYRDLARKYFSDIFSDYETGKENI